MTPGRRLGLTALLATALVIGATFWIFDAFVREDGPAPGVAGAPVQPAPARRGEATLVSVTGAVERQTGEGGWTPVQAGETLAESERLRAGPDSAAELRLDERSLIELGERTEVGVEELTDAVTRLKLVRGRIVADHGAEPRADGERVLLVEDSAGRRATLRRRSKATVLATADSLSVATDQGEVDLESAGVAVVVGTGQQATASAGAAPTAPAPIPREVLLRMAGAAKGAGCQVVAGTVTPGSEVTVDDAAAVVDAAGRFEVKLPPARRSQVTLVLRDPGGRIERRTLACRGSDGRDRVEAIDIQGWQKKER